MEARNFLEALLHQAALRGGQPLKGDIQGDENETAEKYIARLQRAGIFGAQEFRLCDRIRYLANKGVHKPKPGEEFKRPTIAEAHEAIEKCKLLARWFLRNSELPTHGVKATLGGAIDHYTETDEFTNRFAAYGRVEPQFTFQAVPAPRTPEIPVSLGDVRRSWKATLLLIALILTVGGLSQIRWINSNGPNSVVFEQPRTYRIKGDDSSQLVEARSGPGFDFPVFAEIAEGTSLSCTGRTTDSTGRSWIRYENGGGWIAEESVIPEASP